jgi:hypothetical protein
LEQAKPNIQYSFEYLLSLQVIIDGAELEKVRIAFLQVMDVHYEAPILQTFRICISYFSETPILRQYSDDTRNLRSTDTSKPLLAFSFLVCY